VKSRVCLIYLVCLYLKLTRAISDFTGISAPYEAPEHPEIHLKTDETDVTDSVRIITQYLTDKSFI
jgi:adenylylsulfate kinase-like enzyme